MGRPQRSGFSGRNRGRCLRRFWPPWKSPLLPSALRDELGGRLKGCRVAGAVIEAETSICTYQETRQNVPINAKTSKPYTPEERNQEPFAGPSITKIQIKQCLREQKPIQNHHVLFDDYRDAWQELAK